MLKPKRNLTKSIDNYGEDYYGEYVSEEHDLPEYDSEDGYGDSPEFYDYLNPITENSPEFYYEEQYESMEHFEGHYQEDEFHTVHPRSASPGRPGTGRCLKMSAQKAASVELAIELIHGQPKNIKGNDLKDMEEVQVSKQKFTEASSKLHDQFETL